jgi:hypothetical protein
MILFDDIFSWEGWGGKLRLASGYCRLKIFDLTRMDQQGLSVLRPIIAVITDAPGSPMSIKSCTSHIATLVTQRFHISHHRMMFIEYYPRVTYGKNQEYVIEEKYEVAEFTWHEDKAIGPKWRPLRPPLLDLVRDLMGESAEPG